MTTFPRFLGGSGNLLLLVACIGLLPGPITAAEKPISFNRDIRPILSDNCYACHGPDEHGRKAKLRLDRQVDAHAETIVPGKPEESESYLRLVTSDKDDLMPPEDFTKRLTPEQIDLIKRWIAEGAEYQDHWAYVTPKAITPPANESPRWNNHPIDRFIFDRLRTEGLKPSKEAGRHTLIRRVTFDLTGLPPTPAEVKAFLQDTSPRAYEKLVDRLLKSKEYGEHMARFWLDAARYGDTHGLHLDNYREMWPYRDWVIRAFNCNQPFDEFITEQLAGDLLENPTDDQKIATGFNRAHVTTNEGGSIAEEVYVRNVIDRVTTFATVFMGTTSGCSVCHDHKFDPLTQKEFYQFFAFFNSLDGNPMDGNRKDHAPVLKLPTKEQSESLASHRKELASLKKQIKDRLATYKYQEPSKDDKAATKLREIVWIDDFLPNGAKKGGTWKFVNKRDNPVYRGNKSTTLTTDKQDHYYFSGVTKPLVVARGDKLFAHVYLDPKNPPKEIMLQWHSGKWLHRAYWGENLVKFGKDKTTERWRAGNLPDTGKWVRLEIDVAKVGLKPGAKLQGWAFTQFGGTVHWDHAGLLTTGKTKGGYHSFIAWLKDQRKVRRPNLPDGLNGLLKKKDADLKDKERQRLQDHFVAYVCNTSRNEFENLTKPAKELEKKIADIEKKIVTTLVWKELKEPKDAFFLERGQYNMKADKVTRKTPAFLPAFPEDAPRDRLGLAQWLLSPEHPLTMRVTVNRFLQQLFGTGIVKTSEDFGLQGEWPSHPELLDWLAVNFRETGYDVKALMRLMVTSATYRQANIASHELFRRDPENRLLARGPRFRLDAEMLRDQALSLAGLLVKKIGGPGVKPPQPDGLWFAVGYSGSNTVRFKKDEGKDKVHRRSLYTFWKRTSPPPQMNTFDAPSREACSVRRERTNTPLQALMMMNDPQYLEAARGLATRMICEGGDTPADRVRFAFELATSRTPAGHEAKNLLSAFGDYLKEYQANPDAAQDVINIGELPPDKDLDPSELAAWMMVANVILNLDEVINKG